MSTRRSAFFLLALLAACCGVAAQECDVAAHSWRTGPGSPLPPSAASLADIDGDGVRDIVVAQAGIQQDEQNQPCDRQIPYAGIYSGRTRELLRSIGSRDACSRVILSTANAGDLDGDRLDDVAIGLYWDNVHGRVETFSSASGERIFATRGPSLGDRFGAALCSVGDLDGDGRPELAVGAPRHDVDDDPANEVGAVHILRGGPGGGRPRGGSRLYVLEGARANERFGAALALLGNFEGSGVPVLLVGAPPGHPSVPGSARFFELAEGEEILVIEGGPSAPVFGFSVAGGGDIDGDGRADAIVGAPGLRAPGLVVGSALIIYGRQRGAPGGTERVDGQQPGAQFGHGVALLGDLDGDGGAEIAVGAPGWRPSPTRPDTGAVAILSSGDRSVLTDIRGAGKSNRVGAAILDAGDLDGADGSDLLVSSRIGHGDVALHLLADADRNGVRDSCEPCATSDVLTDGEASPPFSLDALSPLRCFRFDAEPGGVVKISVASADPEVVLSIRLRWGESPTRDEFDHHLTRRSDDDVFLLIPHARDETAHVVVNLAQTSGFADDVEVLLEAFDGAIAELVFPSRGALDELGEGSVDTIIKGAGFADTTTFRLEQRHVEEGVPHRIDTTSTTRVNDGFVEATFDLGGSPRGHYDLHVESPGATPTVLERAFSIVSGESEGLYVGLTGTEFYRRADQSQLILSYANTGDVEIAAPIFKIRDNVGTTRMRLQTDDTGFEVGEMQILGVPGRDGGSRSLPPGAIREIPILYRSVDEAETVEFTVFIFRPDEGDFIEWRNLANPDPDSVTGDAWSRDLSPLSVGFGRTWIDYRAALGNLARRLTHRGHDGSSIRDAFRLAATLAKRIPSSAIVGEIRRAEGHAPLRAVDIAAFSGGELVARTVTGRGGQFVLEGLAAGSTVRLQVDGFTIEPEESRVVHMPAPGMRTVTFTAEDVLGLELSVLPGGPALSDDEPPPPEARLPRYPPELPNQLFTPMARWGIQLVGGLDPNAKEDDVETGNHEEPPDLDEEDLLPFETDAKPRPVIHYTVLFENSQCAPGAAATVLIVDNLNGDLFDLSTLHVSTVCLGMDDDEKTVSIDADLWTTRRVIRSKTVRAVSINPALWTYPEDCVDLDPDEELPECDGEEEGEGGGAGIVGEIVTEVFIDIQLVGEAPDYQLIVEMTSCHPDEMCEDYEGFLAINDCESHRGEGFLTYSIRPSPTLGPDLNVDNEVAITFDNNFARTITRKTSTDVSPDVPPGPATFPVPPDNAAIDESLLVPVVQGLSWHISPGATSCALSLWKLDADGARVPVPTDPADFTTSTSYERGEPWESSTTYEWEVSTGNDFGESRPTTWTFRTTGPPPPAPAGDVTLVEPFGQVESIDLVTLVWEPSSTAGTAAEYYSVRLWEEGVTEPEIVANVGSSTQYSPGDLEEGPTYSWQVIIANESGETEGPVWRFSTGTPFLRGDVNPNGGLDISDGVAIVSHLFLGGKQPGCLEAADTNDDGFVDISDTVYLLGFLFTGGPSPPAPHGTCGTDPADETLGCESFDEC